MKELRFETSKGKFLLLEVLSDNYKLFGFIKGVKLSEITEDQASEIVFRIGHHSNGHLIPSAVELLHSLLKSKGIHLFRNPFTPQLNPIERKEAEQKTFYNPYLFKL